MRKLVDWLIIGTMAVLMVPFAIFAAPMALLATWAGRRDDKMRMKQ